MKTPSLALAIVLAAGCDTGTVAPGVGTSDAAPVVDVPAVADAPPRADAATPVDATIADVPPPMDAGPPLDVVVFDVVDVPPARDAGSGPDVRDVPAVDVAMPPAAPSFPEGIVARGGTDDLVDAPQYLVFRKSPTEGVDASQQARCVALLPGLAGRPFVGNGGTCVIFNMGLLTAIPDEATRRAVMIEGFREVPLRAGAPSGVVGNRHVAVEIMIDLLQYDLARTTTYLTDLLAASRAAHVPVFIDFDGVNWLADYFAHTPGATDASEIEWTGFDAAEAVHIGWRDWGSQFRIEQPFPAFTSHVYRAALHTAFARLAPMVRAFHDSLAADERYLYGGLILGTEISVGVNYYHYPFGDLLLPMDPRCDPGLPYAAGCPRGTGACAAYNHTCPPSFGGGSLSGGVQQIGFRAAMDLGLLARGQSMSRPVLDAIVTDYLGFLHHMVLVEFALPSHKIFTHTGGTFGGTMGVHTLGIARVGAAVPGWSMYFGDTASPSTALGSYLDDPTNAPLPWASPEWLPYGPTDTASPWLAAIERSLGYRNNRMISVANWEGVSANATAMAAAHTALTSPAHCAMSPRVLLGTADLPSGTMLHYTRSMPSTASFFNVASSDALAYGGGLAAIDTANAVATGTSSFPLGGHGGTFHAMMVTDGCGASGSSMRVFSPLEHVTAHAGSGSPPPPPWLFTARSGEHVTLSWEVPAGTEATYLNVSSDGTFAAIDAVNANVTGMQLFTWSGGTAGGHYAARIVADGAALGRRISNVVDIVR